MSFYENVDEGTVVSWAGNGFVSGSCYYVPPKYVPVNRGYSTDEQLTGETWSDGKPIYRKTLQGTLSGVAAWVVKGNIGAYSSLVDIRGTYEAAAGEWRPFGQTTAAYLLGIRAVKATGDVCIYQNSASNAAFFITADYTKP